MFYNKKLLAIIGIALVVAFVGVSAFTYLKRVPESELPSVNENLGAPTFTPSATSVPTPAVDYSQVELPASDNEGLDNLITEEEEKEAMMTEEELTDFLAYEEERGDIIPEMTYEDMIEQNKKIEEAKKEAATNPEVQAPSMEPFEIEKVQPAPQKDKDGYIYTKEEAIEIFKTEFQKLIDANDFNYTDARNSAIGKGRSTPEEFEADLKQLLTDPYSSEWLARAFDYFRQYGHIGILIGEASMWLAAGGDDAEWSESYTQ